MFSCLPATLLVFLQFCSAGEVAAVMVEIARVLVIGGSGIGGGFEGFEPKIQPGPEEDPALKNEISCFDLRLGDEYDLFLHLWERAAVRCHKLGSRSACSTCSLSSASAREGSGSSPTASSPQPSL